MVWTLYLWVLLTVIIDIVHINNVSRIDSLRIDEDIYIL